MNAHEVPRSVAGTVCSEKSSILTYGKTFLKKQTQKPKYLPMLHAWEGGGGSWLEPECWSWVGGGLLQDQRHQAWQCMGHFEGGHYYLLYLHHSLVSALARGREPGPSHQQKIGLKIYWAWPCPSEQDPVSPSQFLPSGTFHKPLILLHQRPERMKTTITEN